MSAGANGEQEAAVARRVLIVDDDPVDARLIAEQLRELYGDECEVTHIESVEEAVRLLGDGGGCDLAFVDLNYDGVGTEGPEAVRRVREAASGLPIVACSHKDEPGLARACLDAGAEDFLSKGELQPRLLRRAIGYAVDRRRLQNQIEEMRGARGGPSNGNGNGNGEDGPAAELDLAQLEADYRRLLEAYLEYREMRKSDPGKATARFAKNSPRVAMSEITRRLGDQSAGPRDLMDVHMRVLDRATRESGPDRARACALEGSFLALEMMGHLADYYRTRAAGGAPTH